VKVAVIGAGTMGGMHADLLGAMDEVDSLFVVDADEERADEVARRNGGTAVSFDEATDAAEAIVIATPAKAHASAVTAAIDAGRHVLCEKPLTDALDSSIELTRRIETDGAHVEVGFQRRHDAAFVAARKAVDGRPHIVKLTAQDPLVTRHPWRGKPPEIAPIFRDSSVHDFDLVRWLTGQEATEVHAVTGSREGEAPVDVRDIESAVVSMRLSGGTLAVLDASWLQPSGYDVRVEIVGAAGAVSAGHTPRTPVRPTETDEAADPWPGYLERFEAAYRAELAAFLACCRTGAPPAATARDGLEALRIAVAATRSHLERRTVRLDEVSSLAAVRVA
jgi:myo-inositol 2-dehydrogenase/D-chiro-inositol 1-dehydrogenase